MSEVSDRLTALAREKRTDAFEEAWLEALEAEPLPPAGPMVQALEALGESGEGDRAAVCGSMWLEAAGETLSPAERWDGARRILLLGDSQELRATAADAFRAAHADRDDVERVLTLSGLTGRSSPKRAIRLLGLAMKIRVDAPLLDHDTGGVCRVKSIGPEGVTITGGVIDEVLQLQRVASRYVLLDENDYRVLAKTDPARLAEHVRKNPEAFLENLLISRGGRIRSDELKRMMAGTILPEAEWAGWWTKARNRIKTSRHIVSEGRNPVVLTYVEGGVSLEEQAWDAFAAAGSDAASRQVIGQYLRDAKKAKADAATQATFIDRVIGRYRDEHRRQSGHDESAAFAAAMTIEQVEQMVGRPIGGENSPAVAQLARDAVAAMGGLRQAQLWPLALQITRESSAEQWPQIFLDLVKVAPVGQLDEIATRLIDSGAGDALRDRIAACIEDSVHSPDVLHWVWKRPSAKLAAAAPASESKDLLQRLLGALEDAEHTVGLTKKQQSRVRQSVRAALADRKCARFRECLEQMEYDMASSLRNRINLVTGLSNAVRGDLLKHLARKFPSRSVHDVPRWAEENSVYTTAAGHAKRHEELRVIVEQKMPANAIAIGKAREKGDLSENAEYTAALEERSLLGERAGVIQEGLNQARVLTAEDISAKTVQIGTRLRLRNTAAGGEVTIEILGPWDADLARHIYSYKAPMFQDMMGKPVGETVELNLEGHRGQYEILAIENALAGGSDQGA